MRISKHIQMIEEYLDYLTCDAEIKTIYTGGNSVSVVVEEDGDTYTLDVIPSDEGIFFRNDNGDSIMDICADANSNIKETVEWVNAFCRKYNIVKEKN